MKEDFKGNNLLWLDQEWSGFGILLNNYFWFLFLTLDAAEAKEVDQQSFWSATDEKFLGKLCPNIIKNKQKKPDLVK